MNNDDWDEIIENATKTVLDKAKEELGEEAGNTEIIQWLLDEQAVRYMQDNRAIIKESLLSHIMAHQANRD